MCVPDEGSNLLIMCVPDEDNSRNASCELKWIYVFIKIAYASQFMATKKFQFSEIFGIFVVRMHLNLNTTLFKP